MEGDPQRVDGDPTVPDQCGHEHHPVGLSDHRERDNMGVATVLGGRDLCPRARQLGTQPGRYRVD